MSAVLEFIIRAKDQATGVISNVQARIQAARVDSAVGKDAARADIESRMRQIAAKDAAALAQHTESLTAAQKAGRDAVARMNTALAEQSQPAQQAASSIKGFGQTVEKMSDQFSSAKREIGRWAGVLGTVTAAATAGAEFGRRVGAAIRELWDPVARLAAALPDIERFQKSLSAAKDKAEDLSKVKLGKIADEYRSMADNIERAASLHDKLAAHQARMADLRKGDALGAVDKAERAALLAAGNDPLKQAAASAQAEIARRAIETQAEIDAATAAEAAAVERQRLADEKLNLAMSERDAYQNELLSAQAEKSRIRAAMADVERRIQTDQERTAAQRPLIRDQARADAAEVAAQRALDRSIGAEADAAAAARAAAMDRASSAVAATAARKRLEIDALANEQAKARVADVAQREASARAKVEADLQAQRVREQEELAARDRQLRLENIRAEYDAARTLEPAARDRLGRAQAAAQQAWGWYKDPEAWKAQLAGERQDAEAQKRFTRDADKLQQRFSWRTTQLSDQEEVVRRVIFAREEEQAARAALVQIEINTRGVAEKLDALMRLK